MVTTRPGRDLALPGTPIELALSRLSDADVAVLAISMRGATELSERDIAAIVARVDGVPLFAEELTSTLLEHRADDRPLDLPENVQSSVMARLDMLGGAKYVAQVGSIMGKEFKHTQLAALAMGSALDLEKSIAGLVDWPAAGVRRAGPGLQLKTRWSATWPTRACCASIAGNCTSGWCARSFPTRRRSACRSWWPTT